MRRSFLLVLVASLALAASGCLSPTLPLPPPIESVEVQEAGTDLWTVSGFCDEAAVVTVFNETRSRGVALDCDETGKFVVDVEAKLCDQGWVTQTTLADGTSERTAFAFAPAGTPTGSACDPAQ